MEIAQTTFGIRQCTAGRLEAETSLTKMAYHSRVFPTLLSLEIEIDSSGGNDHIFDIRNLLITDSV